MSLYSLGVDKASHRQRAQKMNKCAPLAAIATGIGYAQAQEFLAIVDLPFMSRSKYEGHEAYVGVVSATNIAIVHIVTCRALSSPLVFF